MPTSTLAIAQNFEPTNIVDLVNYLATINLGYLGVGVTILLFLGGAFYLFNFKPLKNSLEKQENILNDLKNEVEKNLSSSKDEIKQDLVNFKEEQKNDLLGLVEKNNNHILSKITNQIITFEKTFSEKFNDFASEKDENLRKMTLVEVNEKIYNLEKNLNLIIKTYQSENEKTTQKIQQLISTLQKNQKESARKIRRLEVYKYSQEGKMGAIYGSIDLLEEAIDEDSWEIEGSLDDLEKEIKEYKLESDVITRIEEQLVKLNGKPKYGPLVNKIRGCYIKDNSK